MRIRWKICAKPSSSSSSGFEDLDNRPLFYCVLATHYWITANPTLGGIFEKLFQSSKLKARSLFSLKRGKIDVRDVSFESAFENVTPTSQAVQPEKMRFEMLVGMQIEILNGGQIFFHCKFKLNQNLDLNLYRKIQRNSHSIKISIRICTARYREISFSILTG